MFLLYEAMGRSALPALQSTSADFDWNEMAWAALRNCPECHAIVHISHAECLACWKPGRRAGPLATLQVSGEAVTAARTRRPSKPTRRDNPVCGLLSALSGAENMKGMRSDYRDWQQGHCASLAEYLLTLVQYSSGCHAI